MVKTRTVKYDGNPSVLCETYSTVGKRLVQEETGFVFGEAVQDIIEGYDETGNPYSRFHYVEENQEEVTPEEIMTELEAML